MTLTIKLSLDNEAFEEDAGVETVCILQSLSKKIEAHGRATLSGQTYSLVDTNGNKVGEAKFSK